MVGLAVVLTMVVLTVQVLDTLAYAERELLEAHPEFSHARVLVHLSSDVEVSACDSSCCGQTSAHPTVSNPTRVHKFRVDSCKEIRFHCILSDTNLINRQYNMRYAHLKVMR